MSDLDQSAEDVVPETDPRFPSGNWTGFFLQKHVRPPKNWMELELNFKAGQVTGEGRDRVGPFMMVGRYELDTGKCLIVKRYLLMHDVEYTGYAEQRGIWGVWTIATDRLKGGFHIWPEDMPDPTGSTLSEEAEVEVGSAHELAIS